MLFKDEDFSLVLSGGGALGIAQLGVISDLETMNIKKPKEIIGTSMGGIIAACISINMKEEEIFKLFEEFSSIKNWMKFSFKGNSIIKTDKIFKIFKKIFVNKQMKDTNIPLKLISTNPLTGDKKVFNSDDDIFIADALLATMAIPGIFEEKEINGTIYVDGFLTENLGLSEAISDNILAIDVLGKNSFKNFLPESHIFKTTNVLSMFERSMRLLIFNQTKTNIKLLNNKNLILIDINTQFYKTFQFNKTKEIRELGLNLIKGL